MSRIILAGLAHESHSFVPGNTPLAACRVLRGDEILGARGDGSLLDGVLEAAEGFRWDLVPTIDITATPSAPLADEVLEAFWLATEPALRTPHDGVLLVLHGAGVSESVLDIEGEVARRVRRATAAPIVAVLDLHGNISPEFCASVDALTAYRKNPHTDSRASAVRAAGLLERILHTGRRPRVIHRAPRIVWPPTGTGTSNDPMQSLTAMARTAERGNPWSVDIFAGFSFGDTPWTGVSFTATVDDPDDAHMILGELTAETWRLRQEGLVPLAPVEDAVAQADTLPGTTVLVEPSDNIGGGSLGDTTGLLRALLESRVEGVLFCLNDPDAVATVSRGSVGSRWHLPLSGHSGVPGADRIWVDAELMSVSNGRFDLEDSLSHAAAFGKTVDMGPSAVIRVGGARILLTSKKTPPWDLGQWRSQGIEPTEARVIVAKAAVAHRRAYDPIARDMIWVDTPGPCAENLSRLPYRRIARPIFPLDEVGFP